MTNFDSNPIMQTAASGDAAELSNELRSRALSSLYYFAKVVLGFRDLSPIFHLPKCDEIQNSIPAQRRGFLWPRGHFKSTIITKAYPLWRLVGGGWEFFDYSKPHLDPRNRRWLLVGESEGRVTDALKNVKWHVENNQMLRWLFPEIIPPDINNTTWRDDAILLPRSESFDEPSIRAVGIGAKVTGYHGDGFVFDDPFGEKAAKSPADAKAVKDWYDYSPGLTNDPKTVEHLFAGTRWLFGNADLYGALMEELPYREDEYGKPSGIKWFVYSAILDDGTPAFKERFSLDNLEDIRKQQKDYRFSCQYLNTPSVPSSADFNGDLIHTFEPELDENGKLCRLVTDDGTPPVTLQQLVRVSFYDPSSGGKAADCENAIIALGTAADGRQFVLDCFLRNCGYRAAIEHWHVMNDKFVFYKCGYEQVGAQKEIEEIITMRRLYSKCVLCPPDAKPHRKLIPIGIKPEGGSMNKEDRIRLYLQTTVDESKLYLRKGLIMLRNQIVQFPHAKLKDGIDALAYAVHISSRPSTMEEAVDAREQDEKAHEVVPSRVCGTRMYGGYV